MFRHVARVAPGMYLNDEKEAGGSPRNLELPQDYLLVSRPRLVGIPTSTRQCRKRRYPITRPRKAIHCSAL
jgi:hypothetical protein